MNAKKWVLNVQNSRLKDDGKITGLKILWFLQFYYYILNFLLILLFTEALLESWMKSLTRTWTCRNWEHILSNLSYIDIQNNSFCRLLTWIDQFYFCFVLFTSIGMSCATVCSEQWLIMYLISGNPDLQVRIGIISQLYLCIFGSLFTSVCKQQVKSDWFQGVHG